MRQGVGFKIVFEGRETAPRRIAACQFGKARQEAQSEQQPVVEEDDKRRRGVDEENREKAAFQQKVVPLEIREDLSRLIKRQVQHEQKNQDRSRAPPSQQQEQSQQGTRNRRPLQCDITAAEPEQGG